MDSNLPFIEHVYELRRRIFFVVVSVIAFSAVGYAIQEHIVSFLLRPAHGQQFIYTSPGGGINFLFQICIDFGIILSVPVIIYQFLQFLEPVLTRQPIRFIKRCTFFSVILALLGVAFGYYIGLPAALAFLAHQFSTDQIHALFTIQEYLSFLMIYLVGSALIFQIPLVLLFINRVKPLKPQKLLGSERYVILIAFIAAAIITPTPDIFNQAILAGPIIIIYQVGILLVWLTNRRRKGNPHLDELLRKDAEAQVARLRHAQLLQRQSSPLSKPTMYRPKTIQPVITPQVVASRQPKIFLDIKPQPKQSSA